jgi:hypothetical protein
MMGTVAVDDIQSMMDEIARLAPTKRHRLAANMVDGRTQLTLASARMVLTHLGKCEDIRPDAESKMPRPADRTGVAHTEAPGVSAEVRVRQAPEVARMKTGPVVLLPLAAFKEIPGGFYATPRPDGAIDYWKVTAPKGKWAGWKFVRRVLGGPGEDGLRTVELSNIQQRQAMHAIADHGLDEAQELFADTMERCMDCGSPLTDPESRAARKGPTCRSKG